MCNRKVVFLVIPDKMMRTTENVHAQISGCCSWCDLTELPFGDFFSLIGKVLLKLEVLLCSGKNPNNFSTLLVMCVVM